MILVSQAGSRGERDPEVRFQRAIREGQPPPFRPDLGPCLIFVGSTSGPYGQFRYNGRNGYAHRYAWERENGPIPDGLTVDHLCRVYRCVRVAHLELVTGAVNTQRAADARDSCPNGHPYVLPRQGTGRRRCPECDQATHERSAQRRRRIENGLPDRRQRLDPAARRRALDEIPLGLTTVRQAAQDLGGTEEPLRRALWREAQAVVRARDHACTRCGVDSPGGDVHHRLPRGRGGSARPDLVYGRPNLVLLCHDCHMYVHGNPAEGYATGLLVRRGDDPATIAVQIWSGLWVFLDRDGGITRAFPPEI